MTTSATVQRLFAAFALVCAALPPAAHAAEDTAQRAKCSRPSYPRSALRKDESGVSLLGFLIRADGSVGGTAVFSSSGSAALDEAAQEALSKCMFKPATLDGKPIEQWVQVSYVWTLSDDEDLKRAKKNAAEAAMKGDVAARYRLALALSATAKTDTERAQALTVLLSAAELGYAHAQFEAGRRYEKGIGLEANAEEAMRWYRKAAAQGDLLAVQRVNTGLLP